MPVAKRIAKGVVIIAAAALAVGKIAMSPALRPADHPPKRVMPTVPEVTEVPQPLGRPPLNSPPPRERKAKRVPPNSSEGRELRSFISALPDSPISSADHPAMPMMALGATSTSPAPCTPLSAATRPNGSVDWSVRSTCVGTRPARIDRNFWTGILTLTLCSLDGHGSGLQSCAGPLIPLGDWCQQLGALPVPPVAAGGKAGPTRISLPGVCP